MNIEVIGRHALLFDDDATAGFVNSEGALVEWNSLLIDRYDVRHLLSGPPPSRRRRNQTHSSFPTASASSLESELDYERYLDLPPPSEERDTDEVANPANTGGYNAVAFSYGNTDDSIYQKNAESGSESPAFHPPFPVPESLRQSLPPTEKVHQIIARTAMFVSKHGGQSEIVLRVKQGKNPAFGFLMPDDHLHGYFRFLVDHQELVQSGGDEKPQSEEKLSDDTKHGDGAGALSLLGSLYGYGEDDDVAIENASESKQDLSVGPISRGSEKTESPVSTCLKDEAVSKHTFPSKEKATTSRKSSKNVSSSGTKKDEDKLQVSSLPSIPKIEPLMVEPPSDLKKLVEKIVEFIIKNGKQFEAVLVEQDTGHARFPFLLPTNQYHPYYQKVLQKAQESKLTGKTFSSEKDRHGLEKKTSLSKDTDTLSQGSAGCDIPYDSDKKEKFKMVLGGKSKKDGPDQPTKTTHQQQFGVSVDAAAAEAILKAATRGIKNPNFGFLYSSSLNGNNSQARSSDGIQKSDNAIAKTVALEAASEADSSEAHLTREQKLKSERLKRAKMFVAMLKTGAPPLKTESSRGLSVEPQESGVSRSADEVVNVVAKEREGSSAPLDFDKNEKSEKKHSGDECERRSKRNYRLKSSRHEEDDDDDDEDSDDDEKVDRKNSRRRKKSRSHLSSSPGVIDYVDEEDGDDKYSRRKRRSHRSSRDDIDEEDERDGKYSRKKRRSHRSSHAEIKEEFDVEKDDKYSSKNHRSHRSSHEEIDDEDEKYDKYSRKKHRPHRSSHEEIDQEDESEDDKKHRSHKSKRHSKDGRRKRRASSREIESRHRHKRDISSSDDDIDGERQQIRRHSGRSDRKHRKGCQTELEDGEISCKIPDQSRGAGVGGVGGASREPSVDLSNSYHQDTTITTATDPSEVTVVPDDLRSKIRAMLRATM